MNRLFLYSTVMLATLFLTGCQKEEVVSIQPFPVAVVMVSAAESEPSQHYTGQVRSRYEINAAFRVGGKVVERLVDVGDSVKAGTPLARLDLLDYQLAVDAADSELQVARALEKRMTAEEKRNRDLVARSVVSPSEYELARASADAAIATTHRAERMLELAKNRLAYCVLVAEFDSVVTRVLCEKGSVIQEGAPVFQLARIDALEAVVDIPENRIEKAKEFVGKISLWANSKETYETKLREISPNADPITRTYQARYSILHPNADVRLGMTATVELQVSSPNKGIVIPMTAILQRDGAPAVWVVDSINGSLDLRPIQIRMFGQKQAWVDSGLEPGERIVRAGVQKLDASMKVSIWEERIAASN